jgi:hypothetical protein
MLATAAACAAAAGVPATAGAASWKGATAQGRSVKVVTGSRGLVKSMLIGWRAHCGKGRFTSRTGFVKPLDLNVAGHFEDAAPPAYRMRLGKGLHAQIKPHVRGRLGARGNWRGTFGVRIRVFRGTTRIDTCRLSSLSWSAKRLP